MRTPLAPMVEEYNHGKEFPKLKGLRFRRRDRPGDSSKSRPEVKVRDQISLSFRGLCVEQHLWVRWWCGACCVQGVQKSSASCSVLQVSGSGRRH